ncbi:MAG: ribonuclease P protein component [Mariprofundaceae bacterium]
MRLKQKKDFAALRRGHRVHSGCLRLVYLANGESFSRLGMAVSRRYGNAIRRNRLKRCLRVQFRLHEIRHLGIDILVIPSVDWKRSSEMNQDMCDGLTKVMRAMEKRA